MISFVGAGPGAPDLITLRGAQRLGDADVVIWAASLVPEEMLSHCRADVVIHNSAAMTLEDVVAVFVAHPEARIVRLHSGDPTIYSAISEQIDWCVANERAFEIVPGVSSLAAAAAAAGHELTVPGVAQSVVITRLAKRTTAAMPASERPAAFAALGGTMALFLSAARPEALEAELREVGSTYTAHTPAVIAAHVSRPNEQIVRSTVGTLAADLRELGETATVLVLVGPALEPKGRPEGAIRSHVYSPGYVTSFRGKAEPNG